MGKSPSFSEGFSCIVEFAAEIVEGAVEGAVVDCVVVAAVVDVDEGDDEVVDVAGCDAQQD